MLNCLNFVAMLTVGVFKTDKVAAARVRREPDLRAGFCHDDGSYLDWDDYQRL